MSTELHHGGDILKSISFGKSKPTAELNALEGFDDEDDEDEDDSQSDKSFESKW